MPVRPASAGNWQEISPLTRFVPGERGVLPGMVGQNVQAAAADKRAEATFHDASAALHELAHVQGHLTAQDVLLTSIAARLGLEPVPVIDTPPDDTIGPEDETWSDDETTGRGPDT